MYRNFFKHLFDFILSLFAIIVLSPFFALGIPIIALAMRGNPFFVQERPGKKGKLFKLIKFRTMTNAKDKEGNLLQDADRLTWFGRLMRKLSVDEVPELFNIFAGQMSFVGPRPLLKQYLPLYNQQQQRRHDVRPGLTGLAQVSGRNALSWEKKFEKDVYYVDNLNVFMDIKIFFMTFVKVFKREGIAEEGQATMSTFTGTPAEISGRRINVLITSVGRRVELVKRFQQARDALSLNGNVVVCDSSETAPALYFGDSYYIVPLLSDVAYLPALIDLCKKEAIDLIVPTIDTELLLLAEHREGIERETGAKVLISGVDCIKICRDKIQTAQFLKEKGFVLPKTYTESELEQKQYGFPLFIKPKNGSSAVNAFRVKDEKELTFFLDYVPSPIVQECVSGQEYTVDVFLDFDGNIISVVPRVRLAVRGGEILKGQIDMKQEIIATVTRLMEELKPIGHITVQGFWGEDGVFRMIEINPRFGGCAPMTIAAGADSCAWLYRLLCGQTIDKNTINIADGKIFLRFEDSIMIECRRD